LPFRRLAKAKEALQMCYKFAQENKKIKKSAEIFSAPFYHSKLSLKVRSIWLLAFV
jgi:hypothetical protein